MSRKEETSNNGKHLQLNSTASKVTDPPTSIPQSKSPNSRKSIHFDGNNAEQLQLVTRPPNDTEKSDPQHRSSNAIKCTHHDNNNGKHDQTSPPSTDTTIRHSATNSSLQPHTITPTTYPVTYPTTYVDPLLLGASIRPYSYLDPYGFGSGLSPYLVPPLTLPILQPSEIDRQLLYGMDSVGNKRNYSDFTESSLHATNQSQKRVRTEEASTFKSFEDRVAELKEYNKEFGNCNIPQNQYYTGLAKWISNMRKSRKLGTLSNKRIRKLNKAGFIWDDEPQNDDDVKRKAIPQES